MGQCVVRDTILDVAFLPEEEEPLGGGSSSSSAELDRAQLRNRELESKLNILERRCADLVTDAYAKPIWLREAYEILKECIYRADSLIPPERSYKIDGASVPPVALDLQSCKDVGPVLQAVGRMREWIKFQCFNPAVDAAPYRALLDQVQAAELACHRNSCATEKDDYRKYLEEDRAMELEFGREKQCYRCAGTGSAECRKYVIPGLRNGSGPERCLDCLPVWKATQKIKDRSGRPIMQMILSSGPKVTEFQAGRTEQEEEGTWMEPAANGSACDPGAPEGGGFRGRDAAMNATAEPSAIAEKGSSTSLEGAMHGKAPADAPCATDVSAGVGGTATKRESVERLEDSGGGY